MHKLSVCKESIFAVCFAFLSVQNVLYYNSGGSAWSKAGALPSVDS